MNKNVIIGLAAAVVILAGGVGAWVMMSRQTNVPGLETGDRQEIGESGMVKKEETGTKKAQNSIGSLLAMTGNQKCTFNDGQGSSGIMYAAGGKVRVESTVTTEGKTYASQMVSDGKDMYVWTDGETEGLKFSMSEIAKVGEQMKNQAGTANPNKNIDFNKQVDYECSNWMADAGLLTVPANVKFTDMTEMMNSFAKQMAPANVKQEGVDMKAAQCAACEMAGDAAAKAQCKAALGCK